MSNARLLISFLATLGLMGCAPVDRDLVYRGAINETETIELRQDVQSNFLKNGPEMNFAALRISVGDGLSRSGGEIERREFERASEVQRWQFGRLEGRSAPDGQLVWLVDMSTGRVIASLDRYSGAVTGPNDESPVWATANGGVALKRAP